MNTARVQVGDEGAYAIAHMLKMDPSIFQLGLINSSIGADGSHINVIET